MNELFADANYGSWLDDFSYSDDYSADDSDWFVPEAGTVLAYQLDAYRDSYFDSEEFDYEEDCSEGW